MTGPPAVPRRRHTSRIRPVLTGLAVSILLVLGLAELLARLTFGDAHLRDLLQFDPADGRCVALRPGQRVPYTGWFFRIPAVEHDVNEYGFRGPPVPPERSPAPRIAVLGDSFAFGVGVGPDDTIPVRLAQAIRAETGRDVEVLNFGVPGLNAEEVADQFVRFASRWSPDLVLYLPFGNDLDQGMCGPMRSVFVGSGLGAALRTSRLASAVFLLLLQQVGHNEGARRTMDDPGAVARFMAAVERLRSAAVGEHERLGIVNLGWPVAASMEPELRQALREADIPVLDVSQIVTNGRYKIPKENHLNPEGCRTVADAVAHWLGEEDAFRSLLAASREPRER